MFTHSQPFIATHVQSSKIHVHTVPVDHAELVEVCPEPGESLLESGRPMRESGSVLDTRLFDTKKGSISEMDVHVHQHSLTLFSWKHIPYVYKTTGYLRFAHWNHQCINTHSFLLHV